MIRILRAPQSLAVTCTRLYRQQVTMIMVMTQSNDQDALDGLVDQSDHFDHGGHVDYVDQAG